MLAFAQLSGSSFQASVSLEHWTKGFLGRGLAPPQAGAASFLLSSSLSFQTLSSALPFEGTQQRELLGRGEMSWSGALMTQIRAGNLTPSLQMSK
jgi:hypothetical protein